MRAFLDLLTSLGQGLGVEERDTQRDTGLFAQMVNARFYSEYARLNTFPRGKKDPLPPGSEITVFTAWHREEGASRQGVSSWEP